MRLRLVAFLYALYLCGPATPSAAQSHEPQLAPVAHGLLPEASVASVAPANAPTRPFVSDPAGGYSRIVFETDEDPDFKIVIRDFAFPAGQAQHALRLTHGAMLHFVSGTPTADAAIAPAAHTYRALSAPGAAVDITAEGQRPVALRALTLEAK